MKQALIKLHISVFLAGFTGILGALIRLNEGLLVWYRIAITVVTLFIWLSWQNKLERISAANVWRLMGTGALIALHWVCFYGSIKLANVSIGLVCFASVGLFTALLEPLMMHKGFSWAEISLGLISLLGIYLIFHFDDRYRLGIFLGLACSLLAAVFSVLNKKYVGVAKPQSLMLYELSGGLLVLTLLMPLYLYYFPTNYIFPGLEDWGWLLALAWLCTVLAMDLMLQALQKVSAFTQNLSLNLEPVYGILMAFVLFHENRQLKSSFYIGFALIALSVVLQMIRVIRRRRV
ncbi:MAG: DMT family transporter [Chitinophagaceae bacterium]|nr:DMT family transporter [Chitinophagaceae bacterium]